MLPTLSRHAIETAASKGSEALLTFIVKATLDANGGKLDADTMTSYSVDQITLLAYDILRSEMLEGGFIQLIHNGYGPFIFLNPFAKAIRLWGGAIREVAKGLSPDKAGTLQQAATTLHDFSKFIYDGRHLFEKYGEALTADMDDEAFMALYEQYPDFDEPDDLFIDCEESVTKAINTYIDCNKSTFYVLNDCPHRSGDSSQSWA